MFPIDTHSVIRRQSLMLVLCLSLSTALHAGQQKLVCESRDGGYRQCPTGVLGSARLLQQLSESACIQGYSWGYQKGMLWVRDGCRGEFLVRGHRPGDLPQSTRLRTVTCESPGGKLTRCTADTQGGVELQERLSRARCIGGKTWGYDESGIWVLGGCAGVFRIGEAKTAAGPEPDVPVLNRIVCESTDGRRHRCPVNTEDGVRLIRELRGRACIEGHSWGYGRRGIWVDKGCRGSFLVGRADRAPETEAIAEGAEVHNMACRSEGGFKRCFVPGGLSVQFNRGLSEADCIKGRSWGRDRDSVWVDSGCQAEFLVTERPLP